MNETPMIVSAVAQIYAQVAWMEAMKAANAARERRGEAHAYPEADFVAVSDELNRIAEWVRSL